MNTPDFHPAKLRLKWVAEYHGPNPCAESAVVVAELTGDPPAGIAQVKVACANLWAQSGMERGIDDAPDPGDEDALLALGQAAAAWTLAALNEVRGHVMHAAAVRAGEAVRLWVGFHHADLTRTALQLALKTLNRLSLGPADPSAFKTELASLWQSCRRYHPDYQARILMVGAQEMEVPFLHFLSGSRYWQFGWGAKARVFMESSSNADGLLGSYWQKSKATAKALMTALGLPAPAHVLVQRKEEVASAVARVGFPCVVKPLDSGGGKGVTANIRSLTDAQIAYDAAYRQKQGPVMVEAHVMGDDHRLMVIDGHLVGVIRREPSFVVGDGRLSVSALVAQLTRPRSSNMVRSRYLRPIPIDDVLQRHLATQSLRLTDIPAPGQRISLRSNANLSTGGMCTDVTALCHPQVRQMAELLAKTSGLATLGIDYLTTDITKAPSQTGSAFIEMNTTPGLDACIAAGWPEALIARLVLGPSIGRIPVDLIVLSQEGMIALQKEEVKPKPASDAALVIGDVLCVGDLRLRLSVPEPWSAVKAALRNQSIHSVQVICAANDLERLGCPVDRVRHVRIALRDGQAILPPAWVDVLNRHSESAAVYVAESEILKRLPPVSSDAQGQAASPVPG